MNKTIRKIRKKKEREHRKAIDKHHDSIKRLYPRFEFRENGANPQFINIVKKATKQVDLADNRIFEGWERELYKKGKKHGGAYVNELLDSDGKDKTMYFLFKLGQLIYEIVGRERMLNWIPFHDFQVVPLGKKIIVEFHSLKSKSGPNGTIYYSEFEPKMKAGNSEKIVSFSRHAIEQICSRLVPFWQSYLGSGEAFGFFHNCTYFEPYSLPYGRGFTFYDKCNKEDWTYNYVKQLIGFPEPNKKYYYRVGYCPATIEGEFIKAKTLLFPGYRGTPELELIYDTVMPESTRKQFIEKAEKLDTRSLIETKDFSMIQWFHNNGIPQIIDTNKELYRYK